MLRYLETVTKLFREPKISIIKHHIPKIIAQEDVVKDIDKLKVIPLEASSALSKVLYGDIKSFIEVHIDSHTCTHISSACREYPYRIKYFMHTDPEYILFYSECIDVRMIYTIVFGDIIRYFEFIEGFRNDAMFKCAVIPSAILNSTVISYINSLRNFKGINITSKRTREIIEELVHAKDDITEVILILPCINETAISIVEQVAGELRHNDVSRIFVITSAPSVYDARKCGISYRNFFVSYVEILDIVKELDHVYLCNSEANNTEIIINRATYLSSYDINIKSDSDFIPIQNTSFIESFTLKYLRDCLCSSSLTKYKRVEYINFNV